VYDTFHVFIAVTVVFVATFQLNVTVADCPALSVPIARPFARDQL